jgi:hypothetical protein
LEHIVAQSFRENERLLLDVNKLRLSGISMEAIIAWQWHCLFVS